MQTLFYDNQGINTYLVYEIKENDIVDSMSLGMITNNRIKGLAQTIFTQMDSKKYIKYNVSSKVSVSQFFTGVVNKKRLLGVFQGIIAALLSAEEYMLDEKSIILDLDYIFTDVSTGETNLICIPIENLERKDTDISAFFRNIIFSTQFDQTENCDYVARIINYLNSNHVVILEAFKELLDELHNQKSSQIVSNMSQQPNVQQAQPQMQQQAVVKPVTPLPASASVPNVVKPQTTGNTYVNMGVPQNMVQSAPVPQPKVSPQKLPTQVPPQAQTQAVAGEKEISFFYLMQHYNKDNAAAYKAQKEAKKKASGANKGQGSAPASVPQPNINKNATPTANNAANFGFAIPGQPTPAPQAMAAPAPKAASQPVPKQAQMAPQPAPAPKAAQSPVPAAMPTQPQQMNAYPGNAMPQTQSANFGETTILGGGGIGETTVLGVSAMNVEAKPFLIRTKNNEKIPLDKPVFRIGKEKSYVDYFIGDNTAISRSHANIVSRDGEYFVVDTNSTNHTYLNGTMLASNVETKITSGAKIRLANEDFEFKIQ